MIGVYIDNCAWDFLFKLQIDLAEELPAAEFKLFVTGEGLKEASLIREVEKRQFVEAAIRKYDVKVDAIFGFAEAAGGVKDTGRVGGFFGRFLSDSERTFIEAHRRYLGAMDNNRLRPTGLAKNEADLSIASRAERCVVITDEDISKKTGPLKAAAEAGWHILSLRDFREQSVSLAAFVRNSFRVTP